MVQDLLFRIVVNDAGTAVVQRFGRSLTKVGANATAMGVASTTAFAKVGQSTRGVLRGIINLRTAFVTLIAAAAIRKVVTTMAEFESRMLRVGAITGAVGAEFEKLEATAQRLGETTVFTAREAAGAMQFLAQAGFDTNEIIGATPKVLELAAAGMLDLATSADIVTNVMAGMGLGIDELGRANDVLVKTFTSSNVNLQQLGLAFKFAGPIARAAGVDFEELATAIGLLGNAGIQGTLAGTTLKNAIAKLLNPAEKGAAIIKELGLNITDSAGRMLPFADILRQLAPIANDAGKIFALFGQRAGPGMAALLGKGADAFERLQKQIENSAGVAAAIAARQISGLTGSIKLMQSAFEGLILALRSNIQPGIVGFINILKELFTNLKNAVNITNELTAAADSLDGGGFNSFFERAIPLLNTIVSGFIALERVVVGAKLTFNLFGIAFFELVKKILQGTLAIVTFWNDAVDGFNRIVDSVLASVNRFISSMLSAIGDAMNSLGRTLAKIPIDEAQAAAGALLLSAKAVNRASETFEGAANSLEDTKNKLREVTDTEKALAGKIENTNVKIKEQNEALTKNAAQLVLLKEAHDAATDAVGRFNAAQNQRAGGTPQSELDAEKGSGIERAMREREQALQNARISEQNAGKTGLSLAELVFPPTDNSIEARVKRIAELMKQIPKAAGQAILESIDTVKLGLDEQAAALEVRLNAEVQQRAVAENQKLELARQTKEQELRMEQAKFQLQESLFGPNGLANNLLKSGSEKAFKVGKALMLANATAGALVAIVQALGSPFPLNIILPPIVAANAFLQVKQIAAMKFGGGGARSGGVSLPSIGSVSGQVSAPNLPDGDGEVVRSQTVNITVAGFIGDEALLASELGRIINEGQSDGIEFGTLSTSR